MPDITRSSVMEARHPTLCAWTPDALWDAISVRFPGQESIDLKALFESWAADDELARDACVQATLLAGELMRRAGYNCGNPVGYFTKPRARLRWFVAYLEQHPEPPAPAEQPTAP